VPAAQRRGELGIIELLGAGEMAVDEAPVGQWPRDRRVLGWLQFRGIKAGATASVRGRARAGGRWCASLPRRAVEHEDDLLGGTGADGTGKRGQFHREQRDGKR